MPPASRFTRRIAVLGIFLSCGSLLPAAATATFTPDGSGTFPRTLRYAPRTRTLTVDLSALPADATIFRAELILAPPEQGRRPVAPTSVFPVGRPGEKLRFAMPLGVGLDGLAVVRAAVNARKPLELVVESAVSRVRRLEVSYLEGRVRSKRTPVVEEIGVVHRDGQSLITFREPYPARFTPLDTGADVALLRTRLAKEHPGTRYRVWRSTRPITARTIDAAALVGECGPLTGWNDSYHQGATKKKPPVRYRVRDGGEPLPWGTGVWAHNPRAAGSAYYAVTVAIDGEEDLDRFAAGKNATATPTRERVGPGAPVLQWVERPDPKKGWHYRQGNIARLIYTRWESWPRASRPSVPIDYLVAIPLDSEPKSRATRNRAVRADPAPVGLHLHCWGGSCNGGYGWWYNAHRGAVLIASNQVPYDWWTGYHEAYGTNKAWGDGHVHPFTMDRLFAFLDWASRQWQEAPESVRAHWPRLDLARVFTAGNSMGGSGAPMFAVRHGDRIAWAIGWVGVHIPERSPQFAGSYRAVYGPRDANITMQDGSTSPWDWYSDAWWLRTNVAKETGFIVASNGKNDGAIGWAQAVEFARALQETRRPHIFNWAMGGHGTRTLIGSNFDLDVRSDRTLPAFANCSLDDDPGKGDAATGTPKGQLNGHLRWRTDDATDTLDTWQMTIILLQDAPRASCTVDVTPRRCQSFRAKPGDRFEWRVAQDGDKLAAGDVVADRYGLVTIQDVTIRRGENRLRIHRRK